MGHTYATWLPGDPRGFRTKRHRAHVDGDYKSPPPRGKYDGLQQYSKSIMKRPPVYLNAKQRLAAVKLFVESMERREIEVVVASIDSIHFHVLARIADRRADFWTGVAKRETSHYMKTAGIGIVGGLWASQSKSEPIRNRAHQLATAKYIWKHRQQAAAVWFKGKVHPPTKA
jgi:hypothetical protein